MIAFLAAQIVSVVTGSLLLLALGATRLPVGLFVPAAWLAGTGALASVRLLLAQANLPWNVFYLSLPWIGVAAIAAWRLRPEMPDGLSEWPRRLRSFRLTPLKALPRQRLIEAGAAIVIIVWTAALLARTTQAQLTGWDAYIMWIFKGRALYEAGTVAPAFFTDPVYASYGHMDYPILVPLMVARTYAWTGDNDMLVKGLWALMGGAAAAGVYFGLRGLAGQAARLAGLALTLTLPAVTLYAAGHLAGYAEMPLAAFFLYGALFLYRWLKLPSSNDFVLAALFFSLAGFTKSEGLVIAGTGLALIVILGLALRRLNWAGAATIGILVGLILLPWQLEKRLLGITDYMQPTWGVFQSNFAARIGPVTGRLAAEVTNWANLNLIWPSLPVLSLGALGFTPRRWLPTLPLLVLIGSHLAAAVSIYITTHEDLTWHLSTSADRIVFQPTLVALLLGTVYLGMLLDTKEKQVETPVIQSGIS